MHLSTAEWTGVIGTVVALAGLAWAIYSTVSSRHRQKLERLAKEKTKLKEELEHQKETHIQRIIKTIRTEMGSLTAKVDSMCRAYTTLDKKITSNEARDEVVLKHIEKFQETTERRFEAVEKELRHTAEAVKVARTEIIQIGKDTQLIRDAASKLRKGRKGGG